MALIVFKESTVITSYSIHYTKLYDVTITVELITPVACNLGLRFAIREGGRTVGAGQITEILS